MVTFSSPAPDHTGWGSWGGGFCCGRVRVSLSEASGPGLLTHSGLLRKASLPQDQGSVPFSARQFLTTSSLVASGRSKAERARRSPGGRGCPPCLPACGTSLSLQLLTSQISVPTRDPSGPFLMSVDHCFSIRGQGTVMTGTILSGSVSLGDSVEIPALKVSLASPHFLWAPLEQQGGAGPVYPHCRAGLPRLPSVRPARSLEPGLTSVLRAALLTGASRAGVLGEGGRPLGARALSEAPGRAPPLSASPRVRVTRTCGHSFPSPLCFAAGISR